LKLPNFDPSLSLLQM